MYVRLSLSICLLPWQRISLKKSIISYSLVVDCYLLDIYTAPTNTRPHAFHTANQYLRRFLANLVFFLSLLVIHHYYTTKRSLFLTDKLGASEGITASNAQTGRLYLWCFFDDWPSPWNQSKRRNRLTKCRSVMAKSNPSTTYFLKLTKSIFSRQWF